MAFPPGRRRVILLAAGLYASDLLGKLLRLDSNQ